MCLVRLIYSDFKGLQRQGKASIKSTQGSEITLSVVRGHIYVTHYLTDFAKHACYFDAIFNTVFVNPEIYWHRIFEIDQGIVDRGDWL